MQIIYSQSGWGQRGNFVPVSDRLLHASLLIVNSSFCEIDELEIEKLEDTQLCVTFNNVEADTCRGDSGAPIQNIIEPNHEKGYINIYKIVGITSFGPAHCAEDGSIPSVNTKVSAYIDWIEQNVWSEYSYNWFLWQK